MQKGEGNSTYLHIKLKSIDYPEKSAGKSPPRKNGFFETFKSCGRQTSHETQPLSTQTRKQSTQTLTETNGSHHFRRRLRFRGGLKERRSVLSPAIRGKPAWRASGWDLWQKWITAGRRSEGKEGSVKSPQLIEIKWVKRIRMGGMERYTRICMHIAKLVRSSTVLNRNVRHSPDSSMIVEHNSSSGVSMSSGSVPSNTSVADASGIFRRFVLCSMMKFSERYQFHRHSIPYLQTPTYDSTPTTQINRKHHLSTNGQQFPKNAKSISSPKTRNARNVIALPQRGLKNVEKRVKTPQKPIKPLA